MDFRKLDLLTASLTAFRTFSDLVNASGGYRPTIRTTDRGTSDATALCDAYDLFQFARGDARRAVRDVLADIRKPAAPRKPATPRGPSKAQIAQVIETLQANPAVSYVEYVEHWSPKAFDIQYKYPFVSPATGNAFDTEETCAGALAAAKAIVADPTANAEWEDAPDEVQG